MMPSDWGNVPEKPICRTCGCVEFGEDYICLGCGEPLVVRPYPKKAPITIIAAKKWGNHWPADYKKRCFLCGWKYRKKLDSLAPTDPTDLMAAGIWAEQDPAKKLMKIICPGRKLSQRYKAIIAILSQSNENALFPVSANTKYFKLAKEFEGKSLSFCRHCAEKEAAPVPAEIQKPTAVNLAETMADSMTKEVSSPRPTPPSYEPISSSQEQAWEQASHLKIEVGPSPKAESSNQESYDEEWSEDEDWLEEEASVIVPESSIDYGSSRVTHTSDDDNGWGDKDW